MKTFNSFFIPKGMNSVVFYNDNQALLFNSQLDNILSDFNFGSSKIFLDYDLIYYIGDAQDPNSNKTVSSLFVRALSNPQVLTTLSIKNVDIVDFALIDNKTENNKIAILGKDNSLSIWNLKYISNENEKKNPAFSKQGMPVQYPQSFAYGTKVVSRASQNIPINHPPFQLTASPQKRRQKSQSKHNINNRNIQQSIPKNTINQPQQQNINVSSNPLTINQYIPINMLHYQSTQIYLSMNMEVQTNANPVTTQTVPVNQHNRANQLTNETQQK